MTSAPQTLPAEAPTPATVRSLQALVERHSRETRALDVLLKRLVGDDSVCAKVAPRLSRATITQHPRQRPIDTSDPWWPSAPVRPACALAAPVGHDSSGSVETSSETVGISVLGLSGEDLENVVAEVADEQRRLKNFRPVFVTDCPDFQPFISRGFAFEYVSTYRQHLRPDVDEARAQRLASISAKWSLTTVQDRNNSRSIERNHPALVAMAGHNVGMSTACHQNRFEWISETLRLAVSNERYDVVEGLSEYLLAFFDSLPASQQIAAARALCRKFIAFGEIDRLRMLLFKCIGHVRKDDRLYALFSTYCTPKGGFSAEFAKLPSNKTNLYYINQHLAGNTDDVLSILMTAAENGTAETNLLLANYFAHSRDATLYRMFLNRCLGKAGIRRLSKVSLKQGNLLSHITFEDGPQADEQNDLITVIMSAHNAQETIGYAVRSILNQSWSTLELLVCDDGSTDATPEILAGLPHDPRLRRFRSKGQQGTYNIRNALISEARGSFVTFQDADDYAFPERLERQMNYLREHDAAAVAAQWYRVSANGEFLFSSDQSASRLAVVSLMAPKLLYERFGPYRSARFGADTELFENMRLGLGADLVKFQPLPLIFGLSSPTSLTRHAGIEASEDGYRAPARRAYASAVSRRRQMGSAADSGDAIDRVLKQWSIFMESTGVATLAEATE